MTEHEGLMKAIGAPRYGPPDTLRIEEAPIPSLGPGEVLVRVSAASVSSGDARVRGSRFPAVFWLPARLAMGALRPRRRILGTNFSGTIAAAAPGAKRFSIGERVFGMLDFDKPQGSHAEYLKISETGLIEPLPDSLSDEEGAALCFGMFTAMHFLGKLAKLEAGQRLLVIGGAGAVGSAAIQLGRHLGAQVTAVCSTRSAEAARACGAQEIIDYTQRSFAAPLSGEEPYDVVLDCVGAASAADCLPVLRPGAAFAAVVTNGQAILDGIRFASGKRVRVINSVASQTREDAAKIREMVEIGAFRPLVDSVYPMEQAAEAHRRVDSGRKQGSVVLKME